MPKIIENLQSKLIEETRRQLAEGGYNAVTIRSVAAACGVGVGTVYNYFPSKDDLLAAYLLEDWTRCVNIMESVSAHSQDPRTVVQSIYDQLSAYAQRHQAIFQDASAAIGFAGSSSRYHAMLRAQLAAPLRKFCQDDFSAEFIAESLLTWTIARKEFESIYGMIEKLF